MFCSNCGAVIPEGTVICSFCHTDASFGQTRAELAEVNEYTTHAPLTPRQCPCCEITLETVNIATQERFLVEICVQCRGLFFDSNELETLLATQAQNPFHIDYQRLQRVEAMAAQAVLGRRNCPVCQQRMVLRSLDARQSHAVAICDRHGIWLDGGRLLELLAAKKADA